MIQFRLKELMARKARLERRRITYAVITATTRISPSTLSRMANNTLDMVGLSVMDRLCAFFPCTPGELLVRVNEGNGGESIGIHGNQSDEHLASRG